MEDEGELGSSMEEGERAVEKSFFLAEEKKESGGPERGDQEEAYSRRKGAMQ
jgi:hypothetical protein